jgi:hypothetical protein
MPDRPMWGGRGSDRAVRGALGISDSYAAHPEHILSHRVDESRAKARRASSRRTAGGTPIPVELS